ncbi:hypothetical protein CHS0354_010702 [Potamilus streckersoni]|uniref:Cadherin domain-containing protein n=1 Tax=Potamilus streckersoni TaxID=2493646 RepID=A0AAE0TCD8_9BIVA|nr:hypothetical protein CHS0354_010702 [Potamilus streckersoni]
MFITIILRRLVLWNVFVFLFVKSVHGNLVYTLQEELSGTTILGNVASDSGLRNQTGVTDNIFPSLRYSLITSGHLDLSKFFEVEPITSVLKAKGAVDREVLCPNNDICLLSFHVGANSITSGFFRTINVTINVTDINDNAPTFPISLVALTIPENTPINESFPLDVVATDLDAGINSVQRYQILPDTGMFGLKVNDEVGGTHSLSLIIRQNLDRETQEFYEISVTALDGGMPQRTGMLTVSVTISDVNDNRPSFSQDPYNITIDEKVAINSVILRVSATDRDKGENGRVSYFLTSTDPASLASSIALNTSTGDITLLDALIYNPTIASKAYIRAQDNGSPVRSAQTTVFVYVKDSNNNAPVINVNFLFSGQLSENALVNATVAHIDVSDADWGLNAQVTCSCDPCGNFGIRQFGTNTYTLNVVRELDRETMSSYNVTVTCSDSGTPPLSTSNSFIIGIKDENDNAPVFEQAVYIINVTENNAPGATLLKVKATDADIGANGAVRYTFASGLNYNGFSIGPTDGMIRVNFQLDRESQARYSFYVFAHDNGQDKQLTSSSLVTINVLDLNDVYPTFNQSSYTMSLMENQNSSEPVYVGQVLVVDNDEGENGMISYLIPAENESLPFQVLQNGTIIATESLDREKISNYTFEIIAYDHGNVPKSGTASVTVNVVDINDNDPIFLFPTYDNNTVRIEMATKPYTVIARIIASDDDAGNNKKLSYAFEAGNTNKIFQVDNDTGDIVLSTTVLESYLGSHDLTVSAKDHGDPQRSNRTVLKVIVFKSNVTAALTSYNLPSTGQNIMIAITISCVTFVLSVTIIIIICLIRRSDKDKHLYNSKICEEQKIIHSSTRDSTRSSVSQGSGEKMIPMENGFPNKSKKKEVSFLGDEMDGFNSSSSAHTSFDITAMSTFKSSQTQLTQPQDAKLHHFSQDVRANSPRNVEKMYSAEDRKQRDIHRMTSLRVHQALMQTQNSKNSDKPWPESEEGQAQHSTSKPFSVKHSTKGVEDSHSESSGETTTSDSGRGGSDEDVRSSMTNSNEADDLKSPASPSYPFYTTESGQSTFSSFRGPDDINHVQNVRRHNSKPSSTDPQSRIPVAQIERNHAQNRTPQGQRFINSRNSPTVRYTNNSGRNTPSQHSQSSVSKLPSTFKSRPTSPTNRLDIESSPKTHGKPVLNVPVEDSVSDSNPTTYRSQDDDETTTSGSYVLNGDDLFTDVNDMFYKPDTFV